MLEVENIMCNYGNMSFLLLELSHKEQEKSNISFLKLFLPGMKSSEKNEVRNEGEAGIQIWKYFLFVCMPIFLFELCLVRIVFI